MDQVGRYQILEELGRGAHGVVYKAQDPAIGRAIAIKSIALGDIDEADRERVREGILREAKLAGTLSHPNIVTVYDVMDSGDSAYIMMEFVDGKSLEAAMEATREERAAGLSRDGFLSVMKQVAQALDYAHRKGVIHRDVKPANIVLTDQRAARSEPGDYPGGDLLAKIADFGVAKFASHEGTISGNGLPVQTLIGTPNYMSPEQVQGTAVSGASDQFSLAVIAYEVLCGKKAFESDSIDTLLYRIRHEREEAVNKVNSLLSPTVMKVMQRALAKAPADRFATCGEFAGALEFALGDSPLWKPGLVGLTAEATTSAPVPAEPVTREAEPEPEEQNQWGKRLAAMLALGLAVGLAIVLIVRMNSGPALSTQVLDSKRGPVSPPPTPDELKVPPTGTTAPADLSQPPKPVEPEVPATLPTTPAHIAPARTNVKPAKVDIPVPPPKKKLSPVRQVKPVATSGGVVVSSEPPGASVTFDGISSCTTPCSVTLANGRHTLTASLNGFSLARRIFYVPADTSLLVSLVKSVGILVVSSEPSGASVTVDGRTAGTTPLTLRLSPGQHRVSVWDGTRWHDESVQVTGDEVHTRLFRF